MGVRFLDPNGRVFEFEGEFYRAIYPRAGAFVKDLFQKGIVRRLMDKGLLVETRETDMRLDGFQAVLHHQRIPYMTSPFEWSREFLKDAALLVLDLNLELLPHGLGTIDYHPANVQQHGRGAPIWIDFGSFIPVDLSATAGAFPEEFTNNYLFPLLLYAKRPMLGRLTRAMLNAGGITDTECSAILGTEISLKTAAANRETWLVKMRELIAAITFPPVDTFWKDYHSGGCFPDGAAKADPRAEAVSKVMHADRPKHVVDLGCNAGAYTLMAARSGAATLALDFDEGALDRLYLLLKSLREPLSVALGMQDLNSARHAYPIKADFVLALALTHHMSLGQRFPFSHIAERLASYSSHALLTEFMPNGLGGLKVVPDPLPEGYTLENFKHALGGHFRNIEEVEYPHPAGNSPRILIHCTGRR